MTSLTHWHKPGDAPSELVDPPLCCSAQMSRVIDHEIDAAVHGERQRIVNGVADRLEQYAADAGPMLTDGDQRRVFDVAIERCLELVLTSGCICPRIEITQMGESKPRYTHGLDGRCGMHAPKEATR